MSFTPSTTASWLNTAGLPEFAMKPRLIPL
jgi:hypothetical protein